MKVESVDGEPSGPPAIRTIGHVPGLDGMRAIAVTLVLCAHSVIVFFPTRLEQVFPGGYLGVDIFFVLSGFLITALLLREQSKTDGIAFGMFYKRRAYRLLPALFALLAVDLLYVAVTGLPIRDQIIAAVVSGLYVANIWMATGHEVGQGLQHVWSLSIEEQFYLVWPLLTAFVFTIRRSTRVILVAFTGLVLFIVVERALLWQDGLSIFQVDKFYMRTDLRADALLIGALAAHLWVRGRVPVKGLVVAASVSLVFMGYCVLSMPSNRGFMYKGGFTLFDIATAFVILSVVERRWIFASFCSLPSMTLVGRVSYGIYLWHLLIFLICRRYIGDYSRWLGLGVALLATAAVTALSWHFIEAPFLRRKNRMDTVVSGLARREAEGLPP